MRRILVERHADVDLEFVGELIAFLSTEDDGGDRWEEWSVWRTDESSTVKWVVRRIGRSHLEGETDVVHVFKCKDPIEFRRALRRQDQRDKSRWYMTDAALEVLEIAANTDPRLDEAAVERI